MLAQILIIIGASIFGILGLIHLCFTFLTNRFESRDQAVTDAMKASSPILTSETTIWSAWVGFNASHSLGALLVTAVFLPLSLFNFQMIEQSLWFSILPALIGLSYLTLAKLYWFKIPFIGILIATVCFVIAALRLNI